MEDNMYEICKNTYTRRIEKGTLTHDYVVKQKKYISIFLMNDMLTQEQYEELLELLNANDPENKKDETTEEVTTE